MIIKNGILNIYKMVGIVLVIEHLKVKYQMLQIDQQKKKQNYNQQNVIIVQHNNLDFIMLKIILMIHYIKLKIDVLDYIYKLQIIH